MPGQAIVVIGDDQWTVSVATTTAELLAGLSGVASIVAGTGILFDMGRDQSYIGINMSQMLFNLDIVFINSGGTVVGIMRDVAPGETAAFEAVNILGAKYFLEMNAGEAVNVSVGDSVSVSGYSGEYNGEVQPTFWAMLITAAMAMSQIAIVAATTYTVVKTKIKEGKEAGK